MSKRQTGGAKAPKKKEHAYVRWTKAMNQRLRKLFPTASWDALLKAFPRHNRGSINNQARRLGLLRPHPRYKKNQLGTPAPAGKTGTKAAPKKEAPPKPPATDEQIARHMTRGRSIAEVAKEFKMTAEEAAQRLSKGFDGYELFPGPKNLAGEDTYVCVPSAGSFKKPERAWAWSREKSGQPYGVVTFPADFNHQKIRIIPLDGILYGDPAHDDERFDVIIRKIAKEPNTFCFFNGDVIAEIKGGKREEREQILLERSVEFAKKVQPIAHKILWAQQGCLEARSHSQQGFDPLEHFCNKLDIPYFKEPVYIDLFWGNQLFTFWAMHGHSTAQVKGAKMNALRRPATMHEYTHFIIGGHVGDAIWNRTVKVIRNPVAGRLDAKEEFQVIIGNFKKYLGTRAARRGETPPTNETVVLYVYPDGNHHVKTEHGGRS